LRGKPSSYLKSLSDGLQAALVAHFSVPPTDRFQIFHQLTPDELIFDRHYLAGPRSDDFVLIALALGRPRDTATKQAFYTGLIERLAADPGIRPADVMVVITTSPADEWSLGDGRMQILDGGPPR
jgi:hypothetical protein